MPKISVIIPTYMGSKMLGNAIQSVLEQTYSNFELIIVNDASPDNTVSIVDRFQDSRIKYIVHEKNRGVDRSRCTGISASVGEIIVFLDQDDFFHPEKLESHIEFLEKHPKVGFSYNARFELDYSTKTIRDIWRPSQNITLSDLVLWFPIAPSDWVLRRKWALELLDIMSSSDRWTGGEIVYLGDLFMKGCGFGLVNRALNYRWHHSGRVFRDLKSGCNFEIAAQQEVFNDPRFPSGLLGLKSKAHANIYTFWAFRAFVQGETELGQEYIKEAIRLRPSLLDGKPCELLNTFLINCCDDKNVDHSTLLKKIFSQLPPETSILIPQYEWTVARGYLIKGIRAIVWGRFGEAREYLHDAKKMEAEIDMSFLSHLTQKVLDHKIEFGDVVSRELFEKLLYVWNDFGDSRNLRQFKGMFAMNSAFQSFDNRDFGRVPVQIFLAVIVNPKLISNRGLISLLFRSIFNILAKKNSDGWLKGRSEIRVDSANAQ